jgi:hypothetical protein
MPDTRQSLFGPSPEEIQAAQAAQGQQDAMGWAQLPAGRGAVAAAASAGQMGGKIINGLTGQIDPAQAKAQKMQAAQQEAEMIAQQYGVDLATNPKEYYKIAGQTLQKYGLVDEAQNVYSIAQGHDLAERKMQVDEGTLGAQTLSAEAAYLKATADKQPTNKSILTLVPPGTNQKTGKGAVTYNLSDPTQAAEAKQKMGEGYIDVSKLAAPPAPGSVINNYPPAARNFAQTMGDAAAKENYTNYTAARDAHISVDKANMVITALDDPSLIVGPGADARLAIAKGLNIVGADNAETINNTQTLVSQLADTTLSAIATSGLGTGQGFTEKDKQMLQDARAGRIPMTKETLRNITIMNIRAQKYAVEKWNNQLNDYDSETKKMLQSVGIPTDPRPVPEVPKPKKYPSKEQAVKGIPAGWSEEEWSVLTESEKASLLRNKK